MYVCVGCWLGFICVMDKRGEISRQLMAGTPAISNVVAIICECSVPVIGGQEAPGRVPHDHVVWHGFARTSQATVQQLMP